MGWTPWLGKGIIGKVLGVQPRPICLPFPFAPLVSEHSGEELVPAVLSQPLLLELTEPSLTSQRLFTVCRVFSMRVILFFF